MRDRETNCLAQLSGHQTIQNANSCRCGSNRRQDALGVKHAHFCGLSMGGQTGIWLGGNAPDRLGKLVLSNTAAKIGTLESWAARINLVKEGGMKVVAAQVLEHLVHSDRPIIITIVDKTENIQRIIPVVEEMMDTGLMATSAVQMIRLQKRAAAYDGTSV